MNKEQLEKELLRFVSDTEMHWKEVVNAVNEFKEAEPDTSFDSTFSDGQLDRALDSVALKVGWIKDRMDNKGYKARGGLTNKLRKALGYS